MTFKKLLKLSSWMLSTRLPDSREDSRSARLVPEAFFRKQTSKQLGRATERRQRDGRWPPAQDTTAPPSRQHQHSPTPDTRKKKEEEIREKTEKAVLNSRLYLHHARLPFSSSALMLWQAEVCPPTHKGRKKKNYNKLKSTEETNTKGTTFYSRLIAFPAHYRISAIQQHIPSKV